MLNRISKEDLRLMYNACDFLHDKDLIEAVTKDYGEFYLNMKVYRKWGEVSLQVSPFAEFKGNKSDTDVCGLNFRFKTYNESEFGGYYTAEVKLDDFLHIVGVERT